MPATVLVLDSVTGKTTARFTIDAEEMVRNDPARYSFDPTSRRDEGAYGGHAFLGSGEDRREPNRPYPLEHPGESSGEIIG